MSSLGPTERRAIAVLAQPCRAGAEAGAWFLGRRGLRRTRGDSEGEGISRRRWLQLMGASLALAGVAGCRWEKRGAFAPSPSGRPIACPASRSDSPPRWTWPATCSGLLVTCVDGRPIKVEGNPKHPSSLGATNAFAQAAILELYDPDRSKDIIEQTGRRRRGSHLGGVCRVRPRSISPKLKRTGGEGLRVLSEASSSPTLARLRGELLEAVSEGEVARVRADRGAGERAPAGRRKPARPAIGSSPHHRLPGC